MSNNRLHRWVRLLSLSLSFIMSMGVLTACYTGNSVETASESASDSVGDDATSASETESVSGTESESKSESESESEEETDAVALLPVATNFTVSNVFSDNMVVQRDEYVRVWGWADESQNGKRVSGTFLGTSAHTLVENGEWVLTFTKTWEANTDMGNTMTVYGDGVAYEFHDVLVGDVYMGIGQSNMQYTVDWHLQYTPASKHGTRDENALIRLHFNSQDQTDGYPQRGSTDVCREIVSDSRWQLPTEENYRRFSALGYYFAEKMLAANGNTVPIGFIEVEAAGKHLACFLPNDIADATGADAYNEGKGIYESTGTETAATRFVYNHYIAPFKKYAIKGLIWYQGESDLHKANTQAYADRFVPLMERMRSTHNVLNKDFPIYIMELAPCVDANWAWGSVRAIQGYVANQCLTNAYLVPSCDLMAKIPTRDSIHPDIKWEQSKRLAAVAAAVEYGRSSPDATLGPVPVSIEFSDDRTSAVITYANVGDGLTTTRLLTTVNGFVNCTDSFAVKHNLSAEITAPNQVTVTSPVGEINILGYNTQVVNQFAKQVTLCNSYGVPAGAMIFMSDETEG